MKKIAALPLIFSVALSFSGCHAKDNSKNSYASSPKNTSDIVSDSIVSEVTSDNASDNTSKNFLGGTGELTVISTDNGLRLQDDDWFYLGHDKLKKNTGKSVVTVSLCREAGCQHESSECLLYKYQSGKSSLISDGSVLYLAQGNKLLSIDSKGNTDTFLEIKADPNGVSLESGSFQFSMLKRIDDSHIYITASAYNTKEEYIEFQSIYDISDSSLHHIKSEIYSPYVCTDHITGKFYCISMTGDIICVNPDDMSEDIVTDKLDDFPTWDGWIVYDDVLYYINQMGQYCQYDLKLNEKTMIYDVSPFETYHIYQDRVYTIDKSHSKILCGDIKWNDNKVLYESDSQIQGILAINNETVFFHGDKGGYILFTNSGEVIRYENQK